MLPWSLHPFDSFEVRWQQRSCKAAGSPLSSRNRTMFSPKSLNGLGPSLSASSFSVAYQKRRSTFCLVVNMRRSFSRAGSANRGTKAARCKREISRLSLQKRHRWRTIDHEPGGLPVERAEDPLLRGNADSLDDL